MIAPYTERELPSKSPYTVTVYAGYFKTWIVPAWGGRLLSEVKAVAVESWLGTLPLATAHGRNCET
jgi:hypothetical protein